MAGKANRSPNEARSAASESAAARLCRIVEPADGKTYKNAYVYADDKLTQVSHNTGSDSACDVQYNFAYDAAARPLNVKIGAQTLSSNTYNADGTLQKVTFGNGQTVNYAYDGYKRTTGLSYSSGGSYSYQYGANGDGDERRQWRMKRIEVPMSHRAM